MQALHLQAILPDRPFDRDSLERTIEYYEAIIDRGDESSHNYWHLGLAYLLQQREVDAQATWFVPFESADDMAAETLNNELCTFLDRVASEKLSENCLDDAWLICQYLREVNFAHVNNLLRSVLLEIKTERFTPELLTELQAEEVLANSVEPNIDRSILISLLDAILSFSSPLVSQLVRQCLSLRSDCQDDAIATIVNTVLRLDRHLRGDSFLIEILDVCLEYTPKNINVLNTQSRLYCNSRQYQAAIAIGNIAYEYCQNIRDKIVTNNHIIRAMLSSGNWLNADALFTRYYQLLEELATQENLDLSINNDNLLMVASVFLACIADRPEHFRQLQNKIASKHVPSQPQIISSAMEPVKLKKETGVIRIGYLASTFRSHSVGWLCRWLFQYHDRQNFQIFTYGINQDPDDSFYQQWFRKTSHVSYCFSDKPDEIIAQIKADEIDILIDLDSLTLSLTTRILAAKPAPVQVSWLGWDATGLPTVDYFIADNYVLPDNAQEYYQEKIWRLPHSYLAVKGFEIGTPTLKRRDLNIPDDAIIYWSGQVGHKRHPDTVRLQLRILKSVPNSYFLIKGDTDPDIIREFFGKIAAEEGVEFDRLRFLGNVPDEYTHRANLGIADVALDTYPYNGATTTLEILWMGIPLVTRVGQQFIARNSYTFMLNAGIEEGIAWNAEEYVEWGIKLGLDRGLRLEIREKLRLGRTTAPVWNAKQFTLDMEQAYRDMWAIYQEKQQQVITDYSHN
jgi:predicted O-linked N-acetylglucosamine transferase (SPINDLY family)